MTNYGELSYLIDTIIAYDLERSRCKQPQQINLSEKTQILNEKIVDKYLPCLSRDRQIWGNFEAVFIRFSMSKIDIAGNRQQFRSYTNYHALILYLGGTSIIK